MQKQAAASVLLKGVGGHVSLRPGWKVQCDPLNLHYILLGSEGGG